MSQQTNTNSSQGATLLFIAFLVLKLTGVITWSWWWVTAPIWVPAIVVVPVAITIFFLATKKRRH